MGRKSAPYWWKAKKAWFCTINKKRHRLSVDKKEAQDIFHKLMSAPPTKIRQDTVWAILDAYLEWTEKNKVPGTYEWYQTRLQYFKDAMPNMRVDQLKPFHIQQWIDTKTGWSDGHKRGVITAIKRAFNWAAKIGHLEVSPIRNLEKPEQGHREHMLTPTQFKTLLSHINDEYFRDLLMVVWYTGCRPHEIVNLEAKHLHDGFWKFPRKLSKGKREERQVFLTPAAMKICKAWAKKHPEGPIFRNRLGNKWTHYAFNNRFARLKEKLDFKVYLYAIRHSYCHHGLTKGGVDPVVMATLMGHKDTRQIMATYGHLLKDTNFMRQAAVKALSN